MSIKQTLVDEAEAELAAMKAAALLEKSALLRLRAKRDAVIEAGGDPVKVERLDAALARFAERHHKTAQAYAALHQTFVDDWLDGVSVFSGT